MRPFVVFQVTLFLLSAGFVHAQESKIDVNRFHLEAIQGAEAHAAVSNDGPDGQPAVTAVVSKIGAEFWSVELRAPDINFEPGKTYEVKFQAKIVPSQFIYVVPERMDGNQGSVAEGTILANLRSMDRLQRGLPHHRFSLSRTAHALEPFRKSGFLLVQQYSCDREVAKSDLLDPPDQPLPTRRACEIDRGDGR